MKDHELLRPMTAGNRHSPESGGDALTLTLSRRERGFVSHPIKGFWIKRFWIPAEAEMTANLTTLLDEPRLLPCRLAVVDVDGDGLGEKVERLGALLTLADAG